MAAHQQLLYHLVFSTKERRLFLQNDQLREEVWACMAGIAKNLVGFAIRIGGYLDHTHLLVRIPAKHSFYGYVGKLKATSSKHINEKHPWKIDYELDLPDGSHRRCSAESWDRSTSTWRLQESR